MTTDQVTPVAVKPTERRRGGRSAAMIAVALGSWWALSVAFRAAPFWSSSPAAPETVEVDRGDVAEVVVEYGSIESSDQDVVRCQVESFLGLPGRAPAASAQSRPSPATRPRIAAKVVSPATEPTGRVTISALLKVKARGAESQGTTQSGGTGAVTASKPGGSTPAEKSAAASSSSNATAVASDSSLAAKRPRIRSFDYSVEPHIPLRSTLPDQGAIATTPAPPPTILSILPEGSRVKAGDVVCELDSSAYRDALPVQQIRSVQAGAWVEQAKFMLEANEIALREYADGILPQDTELVRNYIRICETEKEHADQNLAWSRAAHAKGFRTGSQVEADAATVQQAGFTVLDAECMLRRLVNYTAKRIVKARRAKIEAIHADLLSLESSLQLETVRLKRIKTMIANCTMRAPRDGIVVHANRVNGWGTVEMQIRDGLAVHQSQPIFRLLDPRHLQVRATINETQVARVRSGQAVLIHLEAYPDRPLWGTVAEITPVSSLTKGPFSDVHSFYATVRIESGGFNELRSGLTAELEFLVASRHQVPRVPLEATRSFGDRTFAAIASTTPDGPDWEWRPIALGATDTAFAEVVAGLKPGDRVIAHSESLPPMDLGPPESERISELALSR
jgi:HlyD family secretion protein